MFRITVAALAAAACAALLTNPCYAERISGKVVGVSDGDTIKVLYAKRVRNVRLAGIDCPEKKQAFGKRAKQFTSNSSFGRVVVVEYEKKDRNGRLIGEVMLPDGSNLNAQLVKQGLAWWYEEYSPNSSLKQTEIEARAAKRGLWSAGVPESPWEFRKRKKLERKAPSHPL